MFYALVHYPDIDTKLINNLRRKYDPQVELIEPHITFVFLLPESVGEETLVQHIEGVLSNWRRFSIHLKGLQKSWDHWLFLILAAGNERVSSLHRELYGGFLSPYHRPDIEFIPHVGLGLFARQDANYDIRNPREAPLDAEKYFQALTEAQQLNLDYSCVVDRLHLLRINDEVSQIVWSKEFALLA